MSPVHNITTGISPESAITDIPIGNEFTINCNFEIINSVRHRLGVTHDLVLMCGVSLHRADVLRSKVAGHQCHPVPKMVVLWVELKLRILGKTFA